MSDEQRLIEKLQRIEALFAGAATPGEREAGAQAQVRRRGRIGGGCTGPWARNAAASGQGDTRNRRV